MNKISHLDCTLRDGGYYNNWNFKISLIEKYLNAMSDIKIDYVEIGFRSLEKNEFRGACAYTTDEFLNTLKIPKNIKIAVMVNASELVKNSSKNKNLETIKKLFKKSNKTKIKLVRIASHFSEISKLMPLIPKLKKLGYKIAINLMQSSDITEKEIKNFCILSQKYKIDILYFADSTGSLNSGKTIKITKLFRKYWKGNLGIHAHDNMGKAMENSISAIDNGTNWVDSTVLGMGRGPGNVKTENIIIELEKKLGKKIDYTNLLKLIDNEFIQMKNKYNWGSNPYYYLSGVYGIHPTFIQKMLESKSYKSEEILAVIENLKTSGGKKFSEDLIQTYKQNFYGSSKGTYAPSKNIRNKNVLILGSGPNLNEHKLALEIFIKKTKPFVIALNTNKTISSKLINVRVVCNTLRLLTDHKSFNQLPQKIILPYQRLSSSIKMRLKKIKKLDFGVEIKHNSFKFLKSSAIIPNSLAITYALAIANSGKAKRIFLAGFDGYDADDSRRREMDQLFILYQSLSKKIDLVSLTPTKYKVQSRSVYSF